MEESDRKISRYNEAYYQILRLHNKWVLADISRESGDFKRLAWILDGIELELHVDLLRVDSQFSTFKGEERLKKINKNLNNIKNNAELYFVLKEKMRFLKEVQDKSGKGAMWKTEDEDVME